MIKSRDELECRKIEIDLHSKNGNAMYLLSLVDALGKQLSIPKEVRSDIKKVMMMGNYENLIKTFDIWFGEYVILYK
ncbi:MAG: hypothetical protein CMD08_01575 [Flavobacteriales bacterium]|nr:hypothetical protein [Flavobacteriales bacterium]|tara:strand:+ start:124 stop:354 length:231 start_codon:yes stop_codon:yes gene_type:complete